MSSLLWGAAVLAIVVLASYVSLGRLLSQNLHKFQDEILAGFNSRVPFEIQADSLRGEWRSFTPEIVLEGLRLKLPGAEGDTLDLSGGRIGLDVLDSLLARNLHISSIELDALELRGELTDDGRFVFPGLKGGNTPLGNWLREFLLNIEHVTLKNNTLYLALPSGEQRNFDLGLELHREGSQRQFQAQLLSTRGAAFEVLGKGVGNPFTPDAFSGQLYVSAATSDLAAAREIFVNPQLISPEGQLTAQLWLDWQRGALDVDLDLYFENLVLQPAEAEWRMPLDELSLSVSLVEHSNRRTVYASDVFARSGDVKLLLPRLQLDSWGESFRLRARDVPVGPLSQLALASGVMPDNFNSVFSTLSPEGQVSALELTVGDVRQATDDWQVEANFHDVVVSSWKGAPGVTSGAGYLELSQNGGYVVLDSKRFTMDFPTVYKQPLYFDDISGTLNINWDRESLLLDSGLITASGVEGTAHALFRLNIPFKPTPTGLEMDLVIGVEDTHPIHRLKYLPYTMNDGLLSWLGGAIGEGEVLEGAFIWRGSLKRGSVAQRTVQLFFNLANTSINYHEQWPPVSKVAGIVLIDDSNVSVWADSAQMFSAELSELSVETWVNDSRQMQLAVHGALSGDASDGLLIANNSMLGELTSGVFSEWQAEGGLEAELDLQLNLTQPKAPPTVEVSAILDDVALRIEPGNLALEELGGRVNYHSTSGFSSDDLTGLLWRQPLTAELRQRPLESGEPLAGFTNSVLEVGLETRVETASLQKWLPLEVLALAEGEAEVAGLLEIAPGKPPTLNLASLLEGISLDLPSPYAKPAAEMRAFSLQLPLASERYDLEMQLGVDLELRLQLVNGILEGASLGAQGPAAPVVAGIVLGHGSLPSLDLDEWLAFSDRYLFPSPVPEVLALVDAADEEADEESYAQAEEEAQEPNSRLRLQLDEMFVSSATIWGQEFRDVRFSLALDENILQTQLETAWLRGTYFQPTVGRAGLKLDYLDFSGMTGALGRAAEEEGATQGSDGDTTELLELPDMQVVISNLVLDGEPLGQLQMSLFSEGSSIRATDIHGELASLVLTPEAPAELHWLQGERTALSAPLGFDDFGDTLGHFGYDKFLETSSGSVDVGLTWPGSPQDFALTAAEGELNLSMERGRFLETPAGATGALRLVSIFNLAEVARRLSLTHMFESGVPFNSLQGKMGLESGTLIVPAMAVEGSSSRFVFTLESDLIDETLDGELVATLPVANNLPWVAALAAGLPVAAGVFVVSKVFEKQVNRLSSGVYTIGGNWSEPTIEFDRIFDDETRRQVEALVESVDPNNVPDPNEISILGLEVVDPNAPLPQ
ncbi:YhdP family protein [Halioglobus maricola]|uniref:YhdP family phospholipid transporter n=1 Tax=Halioglobus maricola TaxID=2601894 RepID=UPI00197A7941|nr:DUF3971 domain-containing protein [Halioglobus maricola]